MKSQLEPQPAPAALEPNTGSLFLIELCFLAATYVYSANFNFVEKL